MTASHIALQKSGELERRADAVSAILASCVVCPRKCNVNRLAGELGKCCASKQAIISGYGPHFGEEPPLVASGGSGTTFFPITTSSASTAYAEMERCNGDSKTLRPEQNRPPRAKAQANIRGVN
jgi:hypothetical protein